MRKKDELGGKHKVEIANVITASDIASCATDAAVLEALRKVSGIHTSGHSPPKHHAEIEARLAFWFFHETSGDFRAEVARSILSTCLVHTNVPLRKEELLTRALELVGYQVQLKGLFRRQIDAFLVDGKLTENAGVLSPSATIVDYARTTMAVQHAAETRLREECAKALDTRIYSEERRQEAVDAVFDDLGFLLRHSLIERLPGGSSQNHQVRLNAVEKRLADYLKPNGGTAQEALKALIDVASASTYGRALTSGELFIQLTARDSTEVAQALTGRDGVEVVLDATVAMPILCGCYASVAKGSATSELAAELYQSLRSRGILISVPNSYVEEMATNLIKAAKYLPIIGQDPALSRSDNFFVAHYHAVTIHRKEGATKDGFIEFLDDFGLPPECDRLDFMSLRGKVEKKLKDLLQRYAMTIRYVSYNEAASLPDEPPRDKTVLMHDRCVAKWLDDRSREKPQEGLVLCTQDRWLQSAVSGRDWIAVDTAALVDLLELVRPQGESYPLVSLKELVCRFDNDVTTSAAQVWDVLAELEGTKLADRELLRDAKEFRDAWLRREGRKERPDSKDWQLFKEKRGIESSSQA
jgi:hypothetical protein